MKNKFTLLTVLLMLCISGLHAQLTQEWVATYNGSPDNYNYMAVDKSGNVFLTLFDHVSGTDDIITVKYNSYGQQQWVARYNTAPFGNDYPSAIGTDSSGNVYVTGGVFSGNTFNFVTLKYNSSGAQQWAVVINGNGNSDLLSNSMVVDPSGDIFLNVLSSGGGCATLKLNSSGQQQWSSYYSLFPNSIAIDESDNIYVAGNPLGGGSNYITLKIDSSGQQQWVSTYNSLGTPGQVAVDISQNVYVTGYSSNGINTDITTLKYNSSGQQQWASIYNGPGDDDDYPSSLAVDMSGNVYVAGSRTVNTIESEFTTIKYNSSGQEQWVKTNGSGSASAIDVDASGNIYVTGFNIINTIADFATVEYNSSGQQLWSAGYSSPGNVNDYTSAIAVGLTGNVYVTGVSAGTTSSSNVTIKYSNPSGISQIVNSDPDKFSLSQNYPNPFNPKTIINYELGITNYVSLKVFDILGNEVASLVSEKQNAGSYSVDFDGSNLSSGIYFYKLQAGEFVETKRMTLVK